MFYSKSTNGFYIREIHGNNIPSDAVEIGKDLHQHLIIGQSSGLIIQADDNGYPFLAEPEVTQEQLESIERAWRDKELARADIELNKVQDGVGTGSVSAWREYRVALRNLPEHELFPSEQARPVAPDA